MNRLTLTFPFYDNPLMLEHQLKVIIGYPEDIRSKLELIVTDDCSPKHPLVVPSLNLKSRFFRTGIDALWNWQFCRNLAAAKASGDWLLMTDIDHVVPVETMEYLVYGNFDPKAVYTFSRMQYPDMKPNPPHKNSWFLTKKAFWEIGGHDERFVGTYGNDGEFEKRIQPAGFMKRNLAANIIRFAGVVPDARCNLPRQSPENTRMVEAIMKMRNEVPDWKPWVLTFPYAEIFHKVG